MRTQDLLDIVQAELRNQLGLAVLRAEPLHHLQGPNSTLLRARLTLHTSEVFDVWIKKARVGDHLRHRIANDFNVTDFLYRELQGYASIGTVRPVLFIPERQVMVTEHCNGETLQDRLERDARFWVPPARRRALENDMERAGAWLASFQVLTGHAEPGALKAEVKTLMSVPDVARIARDRLAEVCEKESIFSLHLTLRSRLDSFLESAQRDTTENDKLVAVHGDFFCGNVLIDNHRTIGFDLSSFTMGSRYFDPTYFLFQLETLAWKPQYPKVVLLQLRAAFLRGYDEKLKPDGFWHASTTTQVFYVLHQVTRLRSFREQKPMRTARQAYRYWLANKIKKELSAHLERLGL